MNPESVPKMKNSDANPFNLLDDQAPSKWDDRYVSSLFDT